MDESIRNLVERMIKQGDEAPVELVKRDATGEEENKQTPEEGEEDVKD